MQKVWKQNSKSNEEKNMKVYDDGITKITDPFWTTKCSRCGHAGWSLTKKYKCNSCHSDKITCTNPAHKESLPSVLRR